MKELSKKYTQDEIQRIILADLVAAKEEAEFEDSTYYLGKLAALQLLYDKLYS